MDRAFFTLSMLGLERAENNNHRALLGWDVLSFAGHSRAAGR